jgi:hypothetical protein
VAERKKKVASSLKEGIGPRITRSSEKRKNGGLKETNYDILRTRSGRLVKKRFKLCL